MAEEGLDSLGLLPGVDPVSTDRVVQPHGCAPTDDAYQTVLPAPEGDPPPGLDQFISALGSGLDVRAAGAAARGGHAQGATVMHGYEPSAVSHGPQPGDPLLQGSQAGAQAGGNFMATGNYGGSVRSHRTASSPLPYSTAGSKGPNGHTSHILEQHHIDFILAHLIAGKSGPYIHRKFLAKFSLLISTETIYHHRDKNIEFIKDARTKRYEMIRQQGYALIDERIILLQDLAEKIEDGLEYYINQNPGSIPPVQVVKELRGVIDDIASELGHRRKGLDVDNSLTVAVIRGPSKSQDTDTWAAQAQELVEQSAAEASLAQLEQASSGQQSGQAILPPA